MPGIQLYSGNRLERLAEKFAGMIKSQPSAVFEKETVVVQSMGMMNWLTVAMSRNLGIWANFEYIFPNRMTSRILNAFVPGSADERFFDKETMTWRCMDTILKRRDLKVFSPLSVYIQDDARGLKLFQLSSKIVDLFDQYMTFRPEMINSWDRGAMRDEWQAPLWGELTEGMKGNHPPALLERVYSMIGAGSGPAPGALPRRISVFGISYLPMYHINILRAASMFCDVDLFILNPSSEYWGNIVNDRERYRIVSSAPLLPGDPEDYMHVESGNQLLASLGRTGRDFLYSIFMNDLEPEGIFDEPDPRSLLGMVQNDIFSMTDRGPSGVKQAVPEQDASITISSCHSVMREVEALHDYILDILNKCDGLSPADILVMSPGIEEYASAIQGVFGCPGGGLPAIPFRIVDRSSRSSSAAIETFFKILSSGEERFTSVYAMALLDCEQVRSRFGLEPDDIEKIGGWVRSAPVYWGFDPAHRGELGLPEIHENTWEFGLERMLLGSMMADGSGPALGVLPLSDIEGSDLEPLGRFVSFIRSLRRVSLMLKENCTLSGWGEALSEIIGMMFADDESEGFSELTEAVQRLKGFEGGAPFSGRVSVDVISAHLDRVLSGASSGRGFVSGALTFCEMLPMRSIPCRVICLLGMNDSSFPRKSKPLSFDLIQKGLRRGDRSVRDEDRYLFLETLVSARERLYISYVGQGMSSNSRLNPSVVVSELIDYIDGNFIIEGGSDRKAGTGLVTEHRIQPYSPSYFISDSRYFTYRHQMAGGARSAAKSNRLHYSFIGKPLPPLSADEKNITIDDLASFLANPAKHLIISRLGIYPELKGGDYIGSEPFALDPLSAYNIQESIIKSVRAGVPRRDVFEKLKGAGALPHGMAGVVAFEGAYSEVTGFFGRFGHLLSAENKHVQADVDAGGINIKGRIENIYGGRCIFFRYASEKATDILTAWVTHLVLLMSGAFNGETILISKGGVKSWGDVPGCKDILLGLAELYAAGMTGPLPLFPRSSYAYADNYFSPGREEPRLRAIKGAVSAFTGWDDNGDRNNPYIMKLFGESYRLDDEFRRLAERVYFPAYENMKDREVL